PPANRQTVGERLQPGIHCKPCYRHGDQKCNRYKNQKIFCQYEQKVLRRSAQYFSDSYFFCSLHCIICRQPQQANAGNCDSEEREYSKNFTEALILSILTIKKFIKKKITEWI